MMADYNGWTDEREEEREALDQLEMALASAVFSCRCERCAPAGPMLNPLGRSWEGACGKASKCSQHAARRQRRKSLWRDRIGRGRNEPQKPLQNCITSMRRFESARRLSLPQRLRAARSSGPSCSGVGLDPRLGWGRSVLPHRTFRPDAPTRECPTNSGFPHMTPRLTLGFDFLFGT